jgi:hypothetical protein
MSFIVTQGETTMKTTRKNVSVPNCDVNKLSYYLLCGTVSCGVDLMGEICWTSKMSKSSVDRQDAILMLDFATFDEETLANKTIFQDDIIRFFPVM